MPRGGRACGIIVYMSDLPEKFFGNDPEDIWDEGYLAGQQGRSMDTNPFRSGEAKRSYEQGKWLAEHPGQPHPDWPTEPPNPLPENPAYGTWTPDEDT